MVSKTNKPKVGVALQIPRNSLALLMIAQVVVILPLAAHITLWIVAVCLMCGYWRTQVHRGRWDYPAGWIKTLFVIASILGIALSGYRTFSLEAATSLLVLAFALKLVEMKSRRDAYLVIFLSYFLVATAFLFDQSMATAAYELIAVIVVTAAMVGMNQLHAQVRPLSSFWIASGLVLQALPLTLVMFLLFPRVAPLWSVPLPSSAKTGISDRLTPGDIASLTQSDELAFRVVFDGNVPAQRDLYWRGLVYSNFLRGTWSIAQPLQPIQIEPSNAASVTPNQVLSYEVFLEPTQSNWLYALDTPVQYGSRMDLLADYRLVSKEPVLSVTRYALRSDTNFRADLSLPPYIRARETTLPPNDNPRLRDYAKQLREQAGSAEKMIAMMLEQIRNQQFTYTLSPTTLSRTNSIDEFWFDSRRGFCTHYAGAMVFALRSADIPARMIGGYQGGEVNPVTGHIVVRQYQAHSWVEAWLPEKGWTRFDPTGAVAPERVESGLNAALSAEDRAVLSFLSNARMGSDNFIGDILQWTDSLEHRWNLWVVGYDTTTQLSVLTELLGEVTPNRIGIALLVGGGVSLSLVAIALFWRRRPLQQHKVERLFQIFCVKMARQGLQRGGDETPVAYIARLAVLAQVDTNAMQAVLQQQLYDPEAHFSFRDAQWLRQELRKLRFRLAFTTTGTAS